VVIGLDTNALIRWMRIDPGADAQSEAVDRAVAGAGGVAFIGDVVLAEFVWVATRRYGIVREEMARFLRAMVDSPDIALASPAAVLEATTAYEMGGAGFADHLIGALNAAAGCTTTLTFDKRAGKGPHFTQLT
jgi:predicted nucleic-acid-binding protein